ncbi:Pimeloyl-ACP methyl ester carboxylesterase [Faunimonas pinastri]|uniref:Pimeloyl-ACP methyl ester carboxylesterase n=1 Tax=Faunimonas pinastri TaxID=1855383 RepID=A0A1H9LD29_9HYPH|nr:Pimeloyl-ACP methyl ester carboxylesterase [Faunimonas pinastri]
MDQTIEVQSLFSGTRQHPIYADRFIPQQRTLRYPVIMIHGGCNTGTCFTITPDGRRGWAQDFARAGIEVFVIDWPGHGRSPMRADFLNLSSRDVRNSIAEMLTDIGPSVLLAHSAGGPLIWSLAEECPDLVKGLVGVAAGPPANLVPSLDPGSLQALEATADPDAGFPIMAPRDELFLVDEAFVTEYWFSGPQAPERAGELFFRSVVPESPRIINERFNVDGEGLSIRDPAQVGARPALIVSPECDPRHPRHIDKATADYLGAEFVWLANHGICGNGHMMMADRNSRSIALLIADWLQGQQSLATAS